MASPIAIDLEQQSSSDSLGDSCTYNSTNTASTAPSFPAPSSPEVLAPSSPQTGMALRTDSSIVEVGADETLWNPDRTRYGGVLMPPEGYLYKNDADFIAAMKEYRRRDDFNGPLTPEEQAQLERWLKAARASCRPLDPAIIDEAMDELC